MYETLWHKLIILYWKTVKLILGKYRWRKYKIDYWYWQHKEGK